MSIIALSEGSHYSIFPVKIAQVYGTQNGAKIYSILITATVFSAFTA